MPDRKLGPNAKRLMSYYMAKEAIPKGGGFADGIAFLTNPERVRDVARDALKFVDAAVFLMRSAPDNPYGDDEEAICAAYLAELEKKR